MDDDAWMTRLAGRVMPVDDGSLSAALASAFPFVSGRLDWRFVPGAVSRVAPPVRALGANLGPGTLDTRAYVSLVVNFLREHVAATPSCWLAYIGDNTDLEYKVRFDVLAEWLDEVADTAEHKYIFPLDVAWCLMWSFEDDLYFGYRPPQPVMRKRPVHPSSRAACEARAEFAHYESLQRSGTSPPEVYRVARSAGMGDVDVIRMLRAVFGLSLRDAKEAMVVGGGTAANLAAHEQAIADELSDVDL